MTSIDRAFDRLRQANPIPEPEALVADRPDGAASGLPTHERRLHMQTSLDRPSVEPETGSRLRRVQIALVLVAAVLLVGVVAQVLSSPETSVAGDPDPSGSREVALALLEAWASWDVEAVMDLVAEDALIADPLIGDAWDRTVDQIPVLLDWYRATGSTFTLGECDTVPSGTGTQLQCPYIKENAWSRAMGYTPTTPEQFRVVVEGGRVKALVRMVSNDPEGFAPVWDSFHDWLERMHPEDLPRMHLDHVREADDAFVQTVRLTPESIQLWELRTEEFAEEVGGS